MIYPYSFEAEIERFGVGKTRKVWYLVLMLPSDLKDELPFDKYPRLRVEGEIADVPISNAFIPTGDGRVYVIVGPEVRDAAGVGLGDRVQMRFEVADQNAVDVPEALEERLDLSPEVNSLWQALSPGKRRGMAHHVGTAKTDATRQKRIDEVIEAVTDWNGNMRAFMDAKRQQRRKS